MCWEDKPLQSISKFAEQNKQTKKIALSQITAHLF